VYSTMGGAYDVYVYFGVGFDQDFMGGTGNAILSSGEYTFTAVQNGAEQNDVPTTTILAQQGYRTMRGPGIGTGVTWDDNTGFIESTGTGVSGNYVKFEDLDSETLVITLDPASVGYQWNQNAILGIQIVSHPMPETVGC